MYRFTWNELHSTCTLHSQNARAGKYRSGAALLADMKWILHNSLVFNGSVRISAILLLFEYGYNFKQTFRSKCPYHMNREQHSDIECPESRQYLQIRGLHCIAFAMPIAFALYLFYDLFITERCTQRFNYSRNLTGET